MEASSAEGCTRALSFPEQLRLEEQICLSLYSATNALIRAYRPLLEPLGLTYPQYLVMLALWERDHLSVKDVCSRTRLDTGTVTPLLKRLEAKGLVERRRSERDERMRVISLTADGRKLRRQAASVPNAMACLGLLSPEQGAEIKRLAEMLYRNATEHLGGPV